MSCWCLLILSQLLQLRDTRHPYNSVYAAAAFCHPATRCPLAVASFILKATSESPSRSAIPHSDSRYFFSPRSRQAAGVTVSFDFPDYIPGAG